MIDPHYDEFIRAGTNLQLLGGYEASGAALLGLGQWLQSSYPQATTIGSQCGEDEILADLLPGTGTYIDVGASDSKECSNSWSLYQRGWRGLLIEPMPECWGPLLLDRPGDYLCPMAASNRTGFCRMRMHGSVSTFREDWPIEDRGISYVRTDTLANILAKYPSVANARLCSIDVEGHEKEVLEGIDWDEFHPTVFVIEYRFYGADHLGEDISDAWSGILVDHGYKLHATTDLNQIWVQ